ncbi:alpha/beta-hydrolase [Collybia nuda]|uniref:Carboxylic ester hydrolase n=1 Tax=Collybia nuda TaxID=64659 RepID=A0A9P5YD63_9AGAR|nr:alpha/beta-hydrolase [Collybia nuda]
MMLNFIFLCLSLSSAVTCSKSTASGRSLLAGPPTVTLDYGTFVGFQDSAGITQYRGVRFADAPIGDLRWQAPVFPPSQRLGRVNATQFGKACIAATQTSVTTGTSEDCLFGNVYIPASHQPGTNLPVLVWFHGGGFQGGDSHSATPNPILQSNRSVIFVSFEYRLGQFGFLGGAQIKENGALNAGLLDQRAALRWVQRYICHFGGDSKRVTIWGQSAGAGSTMFQLLGNGGNTGGLFRAAMGDSPSLSYLPSFTDFYVQDIFMQFSGLAGCNPSGEIDVMSCLRSADSNTLALAGSHTIGARASTLFTFAPIIDGTFLAERPVEAFRNGRFAHVPVLFGSNADEGAHWSASLRDGSANTSMPNATETTVFNFIKGQFATFTRPSFDKAVSDFYPLSDYNGSFSLQGQQMYGEMRYICTAALITGAVGGEGLGAYHYHYENPHLGSFHGDELAAFFPGSTAANADDKLLFAAMDDFWTSFVVSEKPTAENGPAASWTSVLTTDGSPHIQLQPQNIVSEKITDALSARCAFWHSLTEELKS